ncbi:hypothetical protein, partial [Escherichia coli]
KYNAKTAVKLVYFK